MRHDKKFDELCLLYFYQELSEPEAVLFRKHLQKCPICQAEMRRLEALQAKMAHLPEEKPNPALLANLNQRVLAAIDKPTPETVIQKIGRWFDTLGEWVFTTLAKPRYQLATIAATFILGIVVGKIWLSSGLRHNPDMLANLINYNYQMTDAEKENLQKVMAGYLLRSNGVEINDLFQAESTPSAGGLVEVNVKLSKDLALTGGLDDPTIQSLLMYTARQEKDTVRRQRAVRLLTQAAPNPAIKKTLTAVMLHDELEKIRLEAARSLQDEVLDADLLEAYKAVALHDSSVEMRRLAINRLISYDSEDIIPVLALISARDTNENLRNRAQEALDRLFVKYQKNNSRLN